MARWQKRALKLQPGHGWRAKPGHKIFVANRGEVRFEIPSEWVMLPGQSGSVEFHDREPPDDDCRLEVSVLRVPQGIDWSQLPLPGVLEEALKGDGREITYGQIKQIARPDMKLAWVEGRFVDPGEQRRACSRASLARGSGIVPFITMDFWLDQMDRFGPVWDGVLDSLYLGHYIADPTRGPRIDA